MFCPVITNLTEQSLTPSFSYVNKQHVGKMAPSDAERVKRFLDLTSDFSVRRAGAFIGVKGATIHEWRKGTIPEKLRDDNRIAIDNFIEMGGPAALDDPGARDRMLDLLVAERLERIAAQLRAGATSDQEKAKGSQILRELGDEGLSPGSRQTPGDQPPPTPARRPRKPPKRGPSGHAAEG